jgi:hypothetical protein
MKTDQNMYFGVDKVWNNTKICLKEKGWVWTGFMWLRIGTSGGFL